MIVNCVSVGKERVHSFASFQDSSSISLYTIKQIKKKFSLAEMTSQFSLSPRSVDHFLVVLSSSKLAVEVA